MLNIIVVGIISFFVFLFKYAYKTKIEIILDKSIDKSKDSVFICAVSFTIIYMLLSIFKLNNDIVIPGSILASLLLPLIIEICKRKFDEKLTFEKENKKYYIQKRIGNTEKFIVKCLDEDTYEIMELPDVKFKLEKIKLEKIKLK